MTEADTATILQHKDWDVQGDGGRLAPHITPELTNGGENNYFVSSAQSYNYFIDTFVLGYVRHKMCKDYFEGWDKKMFDAWRKGDTTNPANLKTIRWLLEWFLHRMYNRHDAWRPEFRCLTKNNA